MMVPGTRHRFDVPSLTAPAVAGFAALVVGVAAWGFVSTRSNLSVQAPYYTPSANMSRMTSIAYVAPGERQDVIYIRSREQGAAAQQLISFPSAFNLHARGTASPAGDSLGIVTLAGNSGARASLTFITLPGKEIIVAGSQFDFLTEVVWAPDGGFVAGQLSSLPDSAGRVHVDILQANAATGSVATLAQFEDVLIALPIGYSPDGARLFVVTVDQSGSWLWTVGLSGQHKLGRLSTGRTRDWRLSPDGARVAYIDSPVGDRSYSGRVFVLATGSVRTAQQGTEQIGATWRPGSAVPDFGGPGGSLQLDPAASTGSYVVPIEWSPDGLVLVAHVLTAGNDPLDPPTVSTQLVSTSHRSLLSEAPGASFLGWVASE